MNLKKVNNLDCSFRDGGYYNNWLFKKKDINFYLDKISKTNIKYIEIGFRLINDRNSGYTAYTNDEFLKSLKINKNLKIGIMINATDFILKNKIDFKILKSSFPNLKNLAFIRIAFHNEDIKNVIKITKFFSKKGLKVFLNLMQIAQLSKNDLLKSLKILNHINIEALYIADSFGSLNPQYIEKLSKLLKKHCKFKLGFHAHDNLSLAFLNAKKAIENNFEYIDSTIMGMGRGAGNLKTEEIYRYLYKDDKIGIKNLEKIKTKIFNPLKKKYKWGANKYYKFAAINSIHPSYVQEIINNKNYNQKNYNRILNSLAKIDSTKYNPKNLSHQNKILNYKKINDVKLNDQVLILGSSPKLKKYKNKIKKFCRSLKLSKFAVNLNSILDNNEIDYRIASHPQRVQIDYKFYNAYRNKLIIPENIINPKIIRYLNNKNIKFYNYGLKVVSKKKFLVSKKECFLPNYLVLGYALSFVISKKVKKIFIAGFEGFERDDFVNDESHLILNLLKKKYNNVKLISITPTKFNIKYHKLS